MCYKDAALISITAKFDIPHSLVVLTTGECLYEYVASVLVFRICARIVEKQQNSFRLASAQKKRARGQSIDDVFSLICDQRTFTPQ